MVAPKKFSPNAALNLQISTLKEKKRPPIRNSSPGVAVLSVGVLPLRHSSTTIENKKVSHRPIPSYRGRCFTVRFGRDGAAVESGVKCTGEMGKK